VRDDAVIATGRSAIPTRSTTWCFHFIIRGALDGGATNHQRQMEIATVHAMHRAGAPGAKRYRRAATADGGFAFGPDYCLVSGRLPPHRAPAADMKGKTQHVC